VGRKESDDDPLDAVSQRARLGRGVMWPSEGTRYCYLESGRGDTRERALVEDDPWYEGSRKNDERSWPGEHRVNNNDRDREAIK